MLGCVVPLLMLICSPTTLAADAMTAAYNCAAYPKFIQKIGLQQPAAIDTQQSLLPGVVIKELEGKRRIYRHTSWEMSGHVTSTVRDSDGDIYAVPVPSVGLDTNPLERRNTVYRIDSITGVMSVFIKLPLAETSFQGNPFGTLGLTLDCDTSSLYVSSVANSTPREVNGVIYQIGLRNRKIIAQFPQVDAMGLAVFNLGEGKRLYFGDARSSSVFSVALSQNGQFVREQKPRHEFSLLDIRNGDTTQIRKIRFTQDPQYGYKLIATETEFSFRMHAQSHRRYRHYEYIWDTRQKNWKYLQIR